MGWEEGNNILFNFFFFIYLLSCGIFRREGEGEQRHISFFFSICNVMVYVQ